MRSHGFLAESGAMSACACSVPRKERGPIAMGPLRRRALLAALLVAEDMAASGDSPPNLKRGGGSMVPWKALSIVPLVTMILAGCASLDRGFSAPAARLLGGQTELGKGDRVELCRAESPR